MSCAVTGAAVTPETAAGNDPSSLGAAPPITSEGSTGTAAGQPSLNAITVRASTPATAGNGAPLPGPDGPVPTANGTTNGTALTGPGGNATAINSSLSTAGR